MNIFQCQILAYLHHPFFLNWWINFFLLLWVFATVLGAFSGCSEQGLLSSSAWASHCSGFSGFRTQALEQGDYSSCGPRAQSLWLTGPRAQQLWWTVLAGPRHVESSWTRDGTCIPRSGRQTPNHCTSREVLHPHIVWICHNLIYFLLLNTDFFSPKYFLLLTSCMDHYVKYICICVLLNVLVQIALHETFSSLNFPKCLKRALHMVDIINWGE